MCFLRFVDVSRWDWFSMVEVKVLLNAFLERLLDPLSVTIVHC